MTGATLRIKICGVRTPADIHAASQAGADYVGFMFAQHSPRRLAIDEARELLKYVPKTIEAVAVFQDQPISDVIAWPGRVVQLHGGEDEAFVRHIADKRPDGLIIRGFKFEEREVRRWTRCSAVDHLLIDGSSGGHGESFDYATLDLHIAQTAFLAGGLNPENVAAAVRTVQPFGVDVSSGVESERGVKDHEKIRAFCANAREACSTR